MCGVEREKKALWLPSSHGVFSRQKGEGSVLSPEFGSHQGCAYARDSIRKNLSSVFPS